MSTEIPAPLRALFDECHYQQVEVRQGRIVGLAPFLYTWAIMAGLDATGYAERWCYPSLHAAQAAYDDWDGTGDPEGWHKHVPSGRRRDEHGNDLGAW